MNGRTSPRDRRPEPNRLRAALVVASLLLLSMLGALLPSGAASPAAVGPRSVDVAAGVSGSSHGLPSISPTCRNVHPDELLPAHPAEWQRTLACASEYATADSPSAASVPGWLPSTASPPVFMAYDQALVYDSSDHSVLLFGATGSGALNGTQTWTYSSGGWTRVAPSVSPISCTSSALTYDSIDGYVVYLGGATLGSGSCPSAGETWTYHAGVWTQLHPAAAPSVREAASFTNDTSDGYLVLFGGYSPSLARPLNDTWTFVGGAWTELFPSVTPAPRASAGLTDDLALGSLLLWGGTGTAGPLNDTWSFAAGVWTQLHPSSSPPATYPDGLTYDPADSEAIYTAGGNLTRSLPEQVWLFRSGNWVEWTPGVGNDGVVPPQRLGESTAYDWADGYAVLYGGTRASFLGLTDLWSFHAGNWTNRTAPSPSVRFGAATAYDAADGYLLLFGGGVYLSGPGLTYYNDSWAWSSGRWTLLSTNASPPARGWAGMTYDASDGYVLLFGGSNDSGPLNDTWEFTHGGWSKITPVRAPPADVEGGAYAVPTAMAYDAADGYVVLLDATPATSTWSYHGGAWIDLTTGGALTPAVPANPIGYDAADGLVVLFGTIPGSSGIAATNETWTFLHGAWTNRTPSTGATPPVRLGAGVAQNAVDGSLLLFGGTNSFLGGGRGDLNDTWSYAGGAWSAEFSSNAPTARYDTALAYDAGEGLDLLEGGQTTAAGFGPCSTGACASTWIWSPHASFGPVVTSFAAVPTSLDLGRTTNLTVAVEGGYAPYRYAFTGLPAGCTSANTSVLACTPTTLGSATIRVNVTDTHANTSSAVAVLDVVPSLSLVAFVPLPGSIALGERSLLSATLAGGTPPYSYVYTGLPAGCATQSVPTLPCTPWTAGTYTVTVNATDAEGDRATGSLGLTVNATGTLSGPTINAFSLNPPSLTLGNATKLTVSATSTGPWLVYNYSNLPPGCVGANSSSLSCAPTSSGTFSIGMRVTDSHGMWAAVVANLTVYPVGGGGGSALISGFGASPGTVVEGASAVITVVASGGTGFLTYAYPVLPPGCASANTSRLACTPVSSGNFSIDVLVTDAAGHRSGARGELVVVPIAGKGSASGPAGLPWADWLVGGAIGALAAVLATGTGLRRRATRREGEELVRSMNEIAAGRRPPV